MLKLILINAQPGEPHTTFRVDDDAVEVIGRKAPRLRTSDTRVSREHAEVRVQNGVWVIRDLGSANGTLVNNRLISGLCELEEDDTIEVGRVKMIVAVARVEPTAATAATDAGPDDTAAGDASLGDAFSDDDTGFDQVLDPVVVQDEPPPRPARPETPDDLPVDPPSPDEVTLVDATPTPTPSKPSEEAQDAEVFEVGSASDHADDDVIADDVDDEDVNDFDDDFDFDDDDVAHDQAVLDDDEPAEETSEPVDPEPATGLRLANYDVLDDDELAEALAAEAPPAVPVADTSVQIEFPDDGEGMLLDVDAQANADFDADVQTPEHQSFADDHEPSEAPAAGDFLDTPRPAPASADSRLITPAPESALGTYHQDHGFPWRGTAAAVLTLAAVGVGGWLLSQGALSGPLTPVTGPSVDPATTPSTATALAPAPVASAPSRPPIPRGQPSPFDAGPLLTAPITPRSKPIPPRAPAAETPPTPTTPTAPLAEAQSQPQPKPRPATPALAPAPEPTPTPAPAVAITPPPAVTREAPAPAIATATPEPAAGDTAAAAPTEPTAPAPTPAAAPAVAPTVALVPPALADPTPQPTATLLPEIVRDTIPTAQPDTAAAAPQITAPLVAPRRVVYVVDASGSMVDSMNQGVLTWLETQVGSLRPDDAFTVVFFRDDEVLETPPAGLKPGRRAEQIKALDWMAPESGNMRPRGRSRPLAAIGLAASYQANEIVLLTDDNFGLRSGEDVTPDALAQVLRPSDPDAAMPTVHAVQFFYEDTSGRLKDIAKLFGGRYQFVEEPPFDARPALDDLLGG